MAESGTRERMEGGNLPEWTVSDISQAIRGTLEERFGRVRVRGELGRVSRPESGHLYMDLKDENSVLSAVAWRSTAARLPFRPEEGLEVIVTGQITAYRGQSRYQLIVERMELAGEGAMLQAIEQLRRRLEAEGLFDSGRKRPRPALPRIIGVVTSPSGAVIRDILHRLRDRFPCHVLVWPAAVQGEACPREVVAAIEGFNACTPDGPVPRPDLLIVARGGGSVEDLAGFSDESVVRAIAASGIPLISAIGHETDTTLSDHAADLRAPTPTAAAELAVPVRVELLAKLAGLGDRCLRVCLGRLEEERMKLRARTATLPSAAALYGEDSQRLDAAAAALAQALHSPVRHAADRIRAPSATLPAAAVFLEQAARRCTHAALALGPALVRHSHRAERRLHAVATLPPPARILADAEWRLQGAGEKLPLHASYAWRKFYGRVKNCGRLLEIASYQATLKRGFAVVREVRKAREDGQVLSSTEQLRPGMDIEIEFADGRSRAKAAEQ